MATPPVLVLGNVNPELILGKLGDWPEIDSESIVPNSNLRAGGAAGNTALAMAGLNVEHRLIAAVGNDANASWLKGEFQPGTSTWCVVPDNTSLSVTVVLDAGPVFMTTKGHLTSVTIDTMLDAIPPATSRSSFALVTGTNLMPNITAGMAQLLTMLSTMGWTTALDHGRPTEGWNEDTISVYRAWLRATDIVVLLEDDLCAITYESNIEKAEKSLADELADHQILIVLRGRTHVDAFHQGKMVTAKCDPVEPADEVAAIDDIGFGDVFNAGFLNSFIAGEGLQVAIQSGLTVASIAISTSPRRYGIFVD